MNYQTTVSAKEEANKEKKNKQHIIFDQKPTNAFVGASWGVLLIGIVSFCIGLWNAEMELNEKGYYFTIILFGIYSVISLQKSIRDKQEGVQTSDIYYSISWFTTIISVVLLIIGLRNADLLLSEKGFYAISFLLSMFGAITVQKNIRDIEYINKLQIEKEE
ncbi:inner membrane protein YiaA [Tenacibaculum sp.]|nr:inner membrane protein YiaA [Tenacibaculum sp.]